jgi:hypothetical protein
LNITVRESRIEFELWDVLYNDLFQQSQRYRSIISLDVSHRLQWSQVKEATDSLVDFVSALMQTHAEKDAYMDLTSEQSFNLCSVRGRLLKNDIQVKAFPAKIVQGSNPQVNIIDSEIARRRRTPYRYGRILYS